MNPIKALYWNQYFELAPKGKEHTARTNGNVLVAISLSMNLFGLIALLVILLPHFGHDLDHLVKDIFGRGAGRSAGKIIAIIPIAAFYGMLYFTLGSESGFTKIVEAGKSLSDDDQKKVSKKGIIYFIASLVSTAILFILAFII